MFESKETKVGIQVAHKCMRRQQKHIDKLEERQDNMMVIIDSLLHKLSMRVESGSGSFVIVDNVDVKSKGDDNEHQR